MRSKDVYNLANMYSVISESTQQMAKRDPQELTAIQNVIVNELKKRGFSITKISHDTREEDGYPTVFMSKQSGPSHTVTEISGMGEVNGEYFKDGKELKHILDKLANKQEDAESVEDTDMSKSPFHYDPMDGLARAAHEIKDTLKSAANDEARTEHIEKMAEIILGPQSEYASYNEYNRILGGVIELLNHYVVVPMN